MVQHLLYLDNLWVWRVLWQTKLWPIHRNFNCISSSIHLLFHFYQARKLYRSMVLEKKRNEAAIVIAAYCRGWKVIEMWPPSTVILSFHYFLRIRPLFCRFLFYLISHSFHSISFYQARKLYRAMVLEKKRNEAAIVIAAYCRGWKVIEMWPSSTVILSFHYFLHIRPLFCRFLLYLISHSFHSISFYQARKLYRSMVLEKKRNEAAIVIAAYCRGWKVIEMWPPSTVCRTLQFHSVPFSNY